MDPSSTHMRAGTCTWQDPHRITTCPLRMSTSSDSDAVYTNQLRDLLRTQTIFYPDDSAVSSHGGKPPKRHGVAAQHSCGSDSNGPPLDPKDPPSSTHSTINRKAVPAVESKSPIATCDPQGVTRQKREIPDRGTGKGVGWQAKLGLGLRSIKWPEVMAMVAQRKAGNTPHTVDGKEKEKDGWKIVLWGPDSVGKTSFVIRVRVRKLIFWFWSFR